MSGLKYTLIVSDPETLTPVALLAGKPVPEWAEGLVHVDDFVDPSDAPAGAKGQPEPQESDEAEGSDPAGAKTPSKADLEAEIARRNEGRDEADLIKPDGKNKPDLLAALAADDQKSS